MDAHFEIGPSKYEAHIAREQNLWARNSLIENFALGFGIALGQTMMDDDPYWDREEWIDDSEDIPLEPADLAPIDDPETPPELLREQMQDEIAQDDEYDDFAPGLGLKGREESQSDSNEPFLDDPQTPEEIEREAWFA